MADQTQEDIKEIRLGIASLALTVARIDERTGRVDGIEARVRTLEEKSAMSVGLGRAGAQGVSWVLPIVGTLIGILVSVITYLATRGH